MAEVNPLAFIGRSQAGPNTELNKLLAGLGQIEAKGREQRTVQGLANEGRMAATLAPLGHTRESFTPDAAQQLRERLAFTGVGDTASKMQRAGLGFQLPTGGATTAQLPSLNLESISFPGEAEAKILAKIEEKKGTKRKSHQVGDVKVGTSTVEETDQTTRTGEQRQTPLAKDVSTRMLQKARSLLPGRDVSEITQAPDGTVFLKIDGQWTVNRGR